MRVIKAWEGATLAVGRVDAGFVAAAQVVEPRFFVVNWTLIIIAFTEFAFVDHDDVVEEAGQKLVPLL